MPETTQRRQGELKRSVLQILFDQPEGLKAKIVLTKLSESLPPTPFEASFYENNPSVRRYEKIIRFNTISLIRSGWMTSEKGQWAITKAGIDAFHKYPTPEEINQRSQELYKAWQHDKASPYSAQILNQSEESEALEEALETYNIFEEAAETAWSEIEAHINNLDGYAFQDLVEGLLKAMNYHIAWKADRGKDGGVDIIAHSDPLGTTLPRIMVQVKRQQEKVRAETLRSFQHVVGTNDVGLFICSEGFTRDAKQEARREKQTRVSLIDLKQLFDLWVQYYDKISPAVRNLLPIKPIYYLNFEKS